ncbi:MAG: hypothetical protein ABIZ04_05065 [Opitutus sp.]
MKARAVAITVSLLVNVALVVVLVRRSGGAADLPAPSPSTKNVPSAEPAPVVVRTIDRSGPEMWKGLASGSIEEIANRLKAEGFPPRLQRVIVRALVAQQFADRHRALADLIRARPWWKAVLDSSEGAKVIAARQRLQREEDDAVDAVLGPDLGSTPYITSSRLYRYGNLPPSTLAELDRINSDYGELMSEIRNASQGILLPEDREKLLFLARQGHADVAQRLTPEQLFEYDLHSSPEGWWLRVLTGGMNPTEEEFRALFKVRFAFSAPYSDGQYEYMTPEDKQTLAKLDPQLTEQIKAVLTPDRFAEYQLKSTAEYRQTDAFAKRFALPANAAATIVTVQNEITKRADAVRANDTLSPVARNAQLGALADEAVARLTPTLGDSSMNAYKQSAGGWLDALRPPLPPGSAPKG